MRRRGRGGGGCINFFLKFEVWGGELCLNLINKKLQVSSTNSEQIKK